ncbi:F-box/LRR-repeat protein At3g26922-like isoform X2 [Mercurialis annua]|uniref:F-box/LRR-repeat protein At3g26922-like isoform X2 n=1 Tax=Mercurialis annua TaxID=3986 RepID=UPI00215FF856|nr:F-box/LRR-repeat protein At3g26922-like isoform X2 [Mercurialis annua]
MEEQPPPPPPSQAPIAAAADENTIDNLPETLILHILSFLPTLDAVTTSLVSKKWHKLWTMIPSLNFSLTNFPPYKTPSTTRKFFANFIDRTLISRAHSPPSTLRLDFIYEERFKFHVDSWVRYAINNHVQELGFDFFIDRSFFQNEPFLHEVDFYDFPLSALKDGKIRVLRLTRCDLYFPLSVRSLNLWMLKSVYLDQVFLSDQMCLDLMSGCFNLEFLELESCYGMSSLKISSRSLKELEIKHFIRNDEEFDLEIDCGSLVRLNIVWFEVKNCWFKNLLNLVHFGTDIGHKNGLYYRYWSKIVGLLDQIPQIESLAVQNWWLKLDPKKAFSKDFQLYHLKHLELQTGYTQYDLLGELVGRSS